MVEIKTLGGGLNQDDSQYRLPPNDYIEALNISHDAVEGNNDQIITPIIANRIGDATYVYPDGVIRCIGAYANTLRNTVIQFIWNSRDSHLILEYNLTTRLHTKIFENLTDSGGEDILEFTQEGKILSVNIYNRDEGDLLLFLDSLGRPTYMDITAFKAGTYTPVTRDIIDLATRPPLSPPTGIYDNDAAQTVNYLNGKFFRFKYIWTTYDNRSSTTSPISEVLIPVGILSDATTSVQTNNNVIVLELNSGDKDVKFVTLLVSYVDKTNNWSDFLIVETIDKVKQSIDNNAVISYRFYNDSTYPSYDINRSIQLYDYVPIYAGAQELANGNVPVYGDITEGYDNDIIPNVTNEVGTYIISSPISGNLTASLFVGFDGFGDIRFSGIPAVGTTVELLANVVGTGVPTRGAFYTTVLGDTTEDVVLGLIASFGTYGIFSLYNPTSYDDNNILYVWNDSFWVVTTSSYNIVAPSSALSSNSTPVWKWSSQRNIAIAYFDNKGRTNGVVYSSKVVFPPYLDDISGNVYLPKILTSIYHQPPEWAVSFQFLFSKDNAFFLFWATNNVNITEPDYIYFDVTNFISNATKFPTTATTLSYSFQEGDRLRLIKPVGTTDYFGDEYDAAILGLVSAPTIGGVVQPDKQFLKIKKVAPFTNATFTPNLNNYEIEIYRPTQQTASGENKVFYECGREYSILNPGTSTRVHEGELQDQSTDYATPATFEFKKGSTYYRQRIIALNDTTTILFNVQDLNIVDTYISAVNSIDGRPNIIDANAKQANYSTLVRFGQAYQANTNINGLNRFYAGNFDEYDYTYGPIQRFVARDRYIRVFQKYKIGAVPLFNQISKNADGTQLLVVTDKLLNPIQYYAGNFGLGLKESLASFNYSDYGCDNMKGVIWRLSNDGLTPISIVYKMNTWANANLNQSMTDTKAYGAFDQRLNNYIVALSENDTVCVAPYIADFDLPEGTAYVDYDFSVTVWGNTPFTISNEVMPDGMSITVSGHTISFTGTAQLEWVDTPISFTVSNQCGQADIGPLPINVIEMVTGEIKMWGGLPSSPPPGHLVCDGSAVSRTTYDTLFGVIGIQYGAGNGTTTFNLPNIQKKVVAGYDEGDAEYGTVGDTGGSGTATLTDQQIAHKHTFERYDSIGSGTPGDAGPSDFSYVTADTSSIGNAAIARDAVDTRDAFIVLSFIIKT